MPSKKTYLTPTMLEYIRYILLKRMIIDDEEFRGDPERCMKYNAQDLRHYLAETEDYSPEEMDEAIDSLINSGLVIHLSDENGNIPKDNKKKAFRVDYPKVKQVHGDLLAKRDDRLKYPRN